MITSKDFKAEDGIQDHKVAPWHRSSHTWPKHGKITNITSFSTLMGDHTAVTLVINQSIFIKWSIVRFSRLNMIFPNNKVAPDHKNGPTWPKNTKIVKQNYDSCSDGGHDIYYFGQKRFFNKWSCRFLPLKMVFPDHKVVPWLQKQPNLAKTNNIPTNFISAVEGH